ncbi:hypothetical protein [Paraburkholderia antibiotica]|uniref:Uncharacterized protein n=1 Tax=Paraburkholderia antibiotica TaxID=2728839 RepID=A0A7X9X8D4_9BURK|nr:hypothetical protein [Paraburkholderia antibiotica]NML32914.1 hypothetical protein [Paraburkholderia antibiotica]
MAKRWQSAGEAPGSGALRSRSARCTGTGHPGALTRDAPMRRITGLDAEVAETTEAAEAAESASRSTPSALHKTPLKRAQKVI